VVDEKSSISPRRRIGVRRGDFHRIGCRPQKKANLANEIGKEDTSRTTQKI